MQGNYCFQCGQRDEELDPSFKHVMEEVFHDVLHFDQRFLGTLRLLVTRPGQLTQDYMAGRRTRHLPPFRLYIFISFVLFLVLGLGGSRVKNVRVEAKDGASYAVDVETGSRQAANPTGDVHVTVPRAESPLTGEEKEMEGSALDRGVHKALRDPEAFREHLLHWISRVMFLLLPAFALILKALFWHTRKRFVEHAIFSFHFHAFVFSVFLVQQGLDRLPWGWASFLSGLLFLAIPIHLALALKRVYAPRMGKLLLKGALLTASYGLLSTACLFGAVIWVVKHGH